MRQDNDHNYYEGNKNGMLVIRRRGQKFVEMKFDAKNYNIFIIDLYYNQKKKTLEKL